jgi:hypothetical protein
MDAGPLARSGGLVMLPPVAVLGAAAAAVALGGLAVSRQLAARRREALRAAALGIGLEFDAELPALLADLGGMRLVSHGRAHELRNALHGVRGSTAVAVADHRWVTGGGRNRSVHRASLAVLRRSGMALPHLFLRPQIAVVDAIGHMLGGQDVGFPDDEAFSRAFVVQGEDEAAVRALLGPSFRQQAAQLERGVSVEARGDLLLVQRRRLVPPPDVVAFLDAATALLDVLAADSPRRW